MTEEMLRQKASDLGGQGSQAGAQATSVESGMSSENAGFRDPGASLSSMRRGIPKKYDFWLSLQIAPKQ